MKKFSSKVDLWIILIMMIPVALICCAPLFGKAPWWVSLIIAVPFAFLFGVILFGTAYYIDNGKLIIKVGPFKYPEIDITSINVVRATIRC